MMTFPTYGDTFTIRVPKYPKSTWHGIPQRNSWANPRFLDSQHVLRLFTYIFTYIYIYTLSFYEKRNKVPNQRTRWPVDHPKISIARALPQTDVSSSDLLAAVKAWFAWRRPQKNTRPAARLQWSKPELCAKCILSSNRRIWCKSWLL